MLLTWRATVFSLMTRSRRDRAVGLARRHELAQDLELARRQAAVGRRAVGGTPAGQASTRATSGRGAEVAEHAVARLELHVRGVLVTEPAARLGDEHADPRRLVRRLDVAATRPAPAAARRARLPHRPRRAGRRPRPGRQRHEQRRPRARRPSVASSSAARAPRATSPPPARSRRPPRADAGAPRRSVSRRRHAGSSRGRPRRLALVQPQQGAVPAAAGAPAGSRCDTPPRPRRTRRAAGAARLAGRSPRPAPAPAAAGTAARTRSGPRPRRPATRRGAASGRPGTRGRRRGTARAPAARRSHRPAPPSTRARGGGRRSAGRPRWSRSTRCPTTVGDTSPAVTATIASSSRATPWSISPSSMCACPWPKRPSVARSRSPKRSAIRAASSNVARDSAAWPSSRPCNARGRRTYPASTQSSCPSSMSRAARASQPPPRAYSPRPMRPNPSQNAARAAPGRLPTRSPSWWARSAKTSVSSWRPINSAAWATSARSSKPRGSSASAADSCAYAWPQARA